MKKAVVFARVSTLRQEKEGLSLEEIQLPKLRDYALQNGYEIVKEFIISESADRKIRKKFDEMVEFMKKNKDIEIIIAFRVDRITRNYRDAVAMDDLRLDYGKELHFVDDRLTINKDTVGRDIQDWDLKVFLAKQTINRLKEDGFNTKNTKYAMGELPNHAPYGYRNIALDARRKWVEPDTFEIGIVKVIYDTYATASYSMDQIKSKLKKDYNIDIEKSKVEFILSNPFYYGFMKEKKTGRLFPHKYETVISKELFDRVKEVKAGFNKKKFKYAGLPYIYRGFLKCKTCGCTITPEKKVKKSGKIYIYYHCTEYFGKHGTSWVEEKELTEQFANIFKQMQIPEDVLNELLKSLRESQEGQVQFMQNLFDEYTKEYNKLQKRIEESYKDKLDGRITQDMYDKFYEESRRDQNIYKQKLDNLQLADEEYYLTASYLLELASKAYELFKSSELDEKRELIQMALQNLYMKGEKVEYDVQKPFNKILEYASRSKWLRD